MKIRSSVSLPCVKGGGPTNVGGGIVRLAQTRYNTDFHIITTIPQSASLPAPFTQGSHWTVLFLYSPINYNLIVLQIDVYSSFISLTASAKDFFFFMQ